VALTVLPRGTEKILLLEDEDMLRESIAHALTGLGYTVYPALGADDARQQIEEAGGSVDLILADVVLPKQRGDEVARDLKRDMPALKVICMSGYTPENLTLDETSGAPPEFLGKPFSVSVMARKVRDVLDH
jgi:two-component system cell cycle sensor histidine kinase/response regulator CckA